MRATAFASPERDAGRLAALDEDIADGCVAENLGPMRPRRVGDRVGDLAGSAFREAPGAEGAVDLAHVVVQKDVGGSR